jgi:ribonucleoside-diphosphate reductase alpha chain
MICLFDRFDEAMLTCKAGEWYIKHPARARANNSAVLPRGEVSEEEFAALMKRVEESGCGEPGVYWTNNKDWGTNPCCEIALRPYQMCNLTEINAGAVSNQKDLNDAAAAASFIGTLQAGYTDFHYLNPKWKIACEKDALLGVSMTGIAAGYVEPLDLEEAANCVIKQNRITAADIDINPAARSTCVKPAGTTSLVLGVSSGIHAWHAEYYIRRMRAGKDEALAQYMMKAAPALVEQDVYVPHQVVLSFPQKAPEGATVRSEHMLELLERVKDVSVRWVAPGHVDGINQHNVSCTISVKDGQWKRLTKWMWSNRDHYNGISVLPYAGAEAYPQLPFEDITKEKYEEMLPLLKGIDISKVFEDDGNAINLSNELACAGGSCEII